MNRRATSGASYKRHLVTLLTISTVLVSTDVHCNTKQILSSQVDQLSEASYSSLYSNTSIRNLLSMIAS